MIRVGELASLEADDDDDSIAFKGGEINIDDI